MTRLNWRDALATALTGGIVALFLAHRNGADLPLLSGVRALSAVVFIVGVGSCAAGAAPAARAATGPAVRTARFVAAIATTAAAIAVVTGAGWSLVALVGLI